MREIPKVLNTKLIIEMLLMALVKNQRYCKNLRNVNINIYIYIINGKSAGFNLKILFEILNFKFMILTSETTLLSVII